ncbi:MAG: TonB-dependent receptor [Chitinophagales bacterium]|nr:TonB-dependent receptor [Chitinophagales bacterium]
MKQFLPLVWLFVLALTTPKLLAQQIVTGKVVDENAQGLPGATIVSGSRNAATDLDGNFSINVPALPTTLAISYVGYATQTVDAAKNDVGTIQLVEGSTLNDVVIVGARFAPRTAITAPVPIDNIKSAELLATGQTSFDKQLMYTVPSFNSTNQTISDATAHFDPFDLRGLGPSRTLVLVNGKRKNPSSLVYINDTPGKGEVGVDMKSIPAAAIERIEVLRDGASPQYGSDAIAGVINVVLKKDYTFSTANVYSGGTTEGDGFFYGYNVNTGFKIGDRGYINVTHSFSDQAETNRAGMPGQDYLFEVDNDWTQAFPTLSMIVGQPNMTLGDVFYNAAIPFGDNGEVYSFGGITYRRGRSYALYRTPYWRPNDFGLYSGPDQPYNGFQPTFDTDIFDNTFGFGVRGERNQLKYDISYTRGSNTVDYTVANSLNTTMGPLSPTTFRVGGYGFNHHVMNLDLARQLGRVQLAGGTEMRVENFTAKAGEEASYIDGMHPEGYGPAGAQSFPGVQPQNEVNAVRYNIGAYLQADADITENLLLSVAARAEQYSDFGSTLNWKAAARYKFWDDKLTLRASYSTGFRAPSLHQIYLSNIQTLISGGTVSEQGTFNNESSVLRRLGVDKLAQEDATNLTAGMAMQPIKGLSISVDYYNIAVDNRIVYSSSISSSDTTTLVGQILGDNNITSLKFFLNAINTRTSGIDVVLNYNLPLGKSKLGINLAANFNSNEIDGAIITPAPIAAAGVEVFDRKEQSRVLTARPNNKIILGLGYEIGKFRATLNNTRFGSVTWQHATDATKDQTFSAKFVTDLQLSYAFNQRFMATLNLNNLLDIYPDVIDNKGDVVTDLGGRFKYPWEVNQFGFNGCTISGNLNIRF